MPRKSTFRTPTGKVCSKCKRFLSYDSFGKTTSTIDGLAYHCRECQKVYGDQRKEPLSQRRKNLKQTYIESMGGKCSRCGYDEFVSGLDFHHMENKEFPIAKLLTNARLDNKKNKARLEQELSKCTILCRNCHGALHAGEWSLSDMKSVNRYTPKVIEVEYELDNLPLFTGDSHR